MGEKEKTIYNSGFDISTLEIVKSNAENMILDISKSADTLDTKANTYMGVMVLVALSCIGYLSSNYFSLKWDSLLLHESIIVLLTCYLSVKEFHLLLSPREYKLNGTKPFYHIEYDYKELDKEAKVLQDTIFTLSETIEHNLSVQSERSKRLIKGIDRIVNGIFIAVIYIPVYAIMFNLFLLLK